MKVAFLSKVGVNIENITKAFAPQPVTVCRSKDELLANIADADVLIVQNQGFGFRTVDEACLKKAKKLRLIQHHGVAADVTDVEAASALGIPVATIREQNSRSVAEHTFFLLLAMARRARTAARLVREGRMGELQCVELKDKTVCLVGLGTIGKMLVKMARGFEMKVVGVRKNPGKETPESLGVDAVFATADLNQALAQADFVILVLPLDETTQHIIGRDALAAMKPSALLINVSRGGHVDRAAMEEALQNDRVAGYATDAFWGEPPDPNDPLLDDERIIVTPHMGGKSAEAIVRTTNAVHENVMRFVRGEEVQNVLNR